MGALVAIVGGFASGVGLRSFVFVGWPVVLYFILIATLFASARLCGEPRRSYLLGALFFIFCALGVLRSAANESTLPSVFKSDLRHRATYEGVVVADPDIREKNQRIAVVVEKMGERVGALAVMPLYSHVAVGDRVRVTGSLYLPQPFETDYGRTFRYDRYLEARGIRLLIQFGSIRVIEPAPWYSLPAALARVKHRFLDGLAAALPAPASALAGGIVIGGKTGLGSHLQDAFIRSGLVQIIVLSGYNVMIVAEWVMVLLGALRIPRRLRYAAGGAALLLFVGIAGISATAVRASIMALIALYARATARTYVAGRALLVTVFCMLLYNPLSLAFDPGFGLSVAATAGIIWLAPIIESGMRIKNAFITNVIATTLAAQIAVLPLLLYTIGLFSLVAIPANLIVGPLVPLAMAAAAVAGVGGMLLSAWPLILHAIGLPAHALATFFIFIAERASALPYASVVLPRFSFVFVLAAYAALIYFAASKRLSITDQSRLAKNASI